MGLGSGVNTWQCTVGLWYLGVEEVVGASIGLLYVVVRCCAVILVGLWFS